MEKRICFVIAYSFFHIVLGQQCPSYWYGYSDTSKCYRFMYQNKLSWQDARDLCQIYGGDLLKIDTVPERNWIYRQIQNLKNHAKIPTDNWWTGLNNREYISTWEWADGSPVARNILNWKPGEPKNAGGDERCGEISNGKINDEGCTDLNRYVCSRDRGIPLKCDSDHGWQTANGYCYKVYTAKANWYNAKRRCEHDGGGLVTIGSENEEIIMHDFAVNFKQQLWIGLYSLQQPGNKVQWMWTNQSQLSSSYWHGTPHVDRHHLNNSCAVVSNSISNIQAWSVQTCAQSKAYVCKKQEGVCFPGWIGYQTYCYQFDAQYRLSFSGATNYCQRQGAELLRYTGDSARKFVNSYIQEMKDSGDQDFWIGASDNNKDGGPYKWRNGQTVTYKWWAAAHNTPANTRGRQDCAYVSTSDRNGKWRTSTNCGAQKPFVCLIPMGKSVRPIPRTPRPRYGCPANWRLYSGTCYRTFDQGVDWLTARNRCQQTKGADLVAIRSSVAQNFVNRICRHGMQYWIGLNDRTTDGVYVWNDETTPTTFTAWQPHQPSNSGHQENCVVQLNNRWNDITCSAKKHYICSKDANSVLPPASTTVAMDWTLKCGPGWESNPVTSSCYKYVDEQLSWLDALNQCQVFKSTLVTIESLEEQNYLAGRIQSKSSIGLWIGANDRGTEGGWRWASGKPFAFLNWAAGNPSAHGQGTDCVVMFTQNARWDDIDCNQRNGYVCEKTGNVPTTRPPRTTTPKIPAGMKLGCRPGWKPYGSNCFYFGRMKINWLNAQVTCGHLGGRLASIQGRNEQNFVTANLWKNPKDRYDGIWIGLNDRTSESRFTWDDGSVVMYTNWGTNEPNSWRNHNEDCVETKLNNGRWNDETCTTMKSGFICKAPKSIVSATQNPYQTGCPLNSLGYNSYCYKIVAGMARNWNDANTWCHRTLHGSLATVNDRYLQSFLSSQLLYRTGYFWLGLTDRSKPGTYSWASGDPVLFTYWYNTHTGNERSTCIGMRADQPIGLWENLACTAKQNFICQFPRHGGFSTLPTTPTPYPNLPCPQGWTGNQGQCYYVFSDPKQRLTWMDAVSYCQSLGGDLPSFHTSHNDSFLQTLIPQSLGFQLFWIGLNDRDTETGYKWSDGSAVDYTNWKANEPNNYRGNEDCVAYISTSHDWNDMNCYSTTGYICAKPRDSPFLHKTSTPFNLAQNGSICSMDLCTGSEILTSNAYNYQVVGIDISGTNSIVFEVQACHDAHLLLMKHAGDEDHDVYEIVLGGWRNTKSVIRTSKQQNPPDASVTHKPLDCATSKAFWVSWARGQLQVGSGVIVGTDKFLSYDSHSTLTVNSIAVSTGFGSSGKWTFGTTLPASTVIPTPARSSKCGSDPNWYFYNNNCYIFNPTSGPNATLAWYDANDYCNGISANLLSIHNNDENSFIQGIIHTTASISHIWTGFNELGLSGYSWTDGTPVDFTNWRANEPNDAFGGERCVEMDNNGNWNDNNCGLKLGFVCKKPVSGQVVITSPSPYPPGGCANGFTRVPGGRNKCFYLNNNKLNWTTARDQCRRFGKGYDIASIEDLYEQDFFLSLAIRKYSNIWIGLSDRQINNKWLWQDNSPVVYTNWDHGEPTSSFAQAKNKESQNCVAIRMYKGHMGKWADVDCDQAFMSVCQAKQDPNLQIIAPPNSCKKGYKPYQRGCYKLSTGVKTWNDSKAACQADGGNLTSVNNVYESGFIVTVGSTGLPFWIGLSDSLIPGLYGWIDGWPVRYTNWGYNEPSYDNPGGCVLVNRNGKWNDTDCSRKLHYVCKITSVKPPATTPTPPGQCANTKWIPNGDYCYSVSVNQGRSWPEANYQCQKNGMQLASIHSQAEMAFVLNLITQAKVTNPQYKPNIFIGISKNPQGSFAWTDGSAVNYLNWNPGQPTGLGTHGQLEECIEFDRTTGKWNDVDCFTNRGYVCKALKVFQTTPLTTTVNPVNGNPTNPAQTFPPPVTWPNGSIAVPGRQSAQQQRQTKESTLGLSGGGIAGVVIGCVAVIVLVALLLALLRTRGVVKPPRLDRSSSGGGLGFDNALYNRGNDNVKIDSDA